MLVISSLDPCQSIVCEFYSICRRSIDGLSHVCECPSNCSKANSPPVCGSDGKIYENECELQRYSCTNRVKITAESKTACGRWSLEWITRDILSVSAIETAVLCWWMGVKNFHATLNVMFELHWQGQNHRFHDKPFKSLARCVLGVWKSRNPESGTRAGNGNGNGTGTGTRTRTRT